MRQRSNGRYAVWIRSHGLLIAASAIFLGLELGLVDRFPVFYDESLFVAESQLGLDHPTLNNLFLAAMDNHGPLQRWLGMAWLELGFASITAIRLVSILSGLLIVVGVWIAARPLGRTAANLSSLVAAVMPGLVVHSAVGIADPLVAAFLTLALAGQLRLAERPTVRLALGVGAALAVALLAKKSALLGLALMPLTIPWTRPQLRERAGPWLRWLAAAAIVIALAAAGWLVLLLAPARLRHIGSVYSFEQYRSLDEIVRQIPGYLGGNARSFAKVLGGYATLPVLAAAIGGLTAAIRSRPRAAALLAGWVLLPCAVAIVAAKNVYPRYILVAFPPLAILAGVGLAAAWSRLSASAPGRLLAPAAIIALLAPALVYDGRIVASPGTVHYTGLDDMQYISGFAAGTPWTAIAARLEQAGRDVRSREVVVAYGGHSTGPIGLAGVIGHPKLASGSINAVDFFATDLHGRRYHFVSYQSDPGAQFIIAQEFDTVRPPPSVLARTRPLLVVQRPHRGSLVALLERKR